MKPTLRHIFLAVGIVLMVAGIVMGHSAEPPREVQNTYKALEWAQNDSILSLQLQQGYSKELCEMAVKAYMEAHNLSSITFPYVCWDWRGPPKSGAQTTAESLFGAGTAFVIMGLPGLFRR